ncbi:hypothetical protein JKP88DRAFT_247108 [Tribonema minus]|uniref:Uncharacterized protein n=1 Tax=Tribonema minus TaxID=303371 RepID=A0A836CCH5_9STRA|nr:hypothetical protein JKP88DRAFT_247108 [Tribonema minus]
MIQPAAAAAADEDDSFLSTYQDLKPYGWHHIIASVEALKAAKYKPHYEAMPAWFYCRPGIRKGIPTGELLAHYEEHHDFFADERGVVHFVEAHKRADRDVRAVQLQNLNIWNLKIFTRIIQMAAQGGAGPQAGEAHEPPAWVLHGLPDDAGWHMRQLERLTEMGIQVNVAEIRNNLAAAFADLRFTWHRPMATADDTHSMSALEYVWPETSLLWVYPALQAGVDYGTEDPDGVLSYAERCLRDYPLRKTEYRQKLTAAGMRRVSNLRNCRRLMTANRRYLGHWLQLEPVIMWLVHQPVWPLWLAVWFGPRYPGNPHHHPIWMADTPIATHYHNAVAAAFHNPANYYDAAMARVNFLYGTGVDLQAADEP